MSNIIEELLDDEFGPNQAAVNMGIDHLYGEHPAHRAITALEALAWVITSQEQMTIEHHKSFERVIRVAREKHWGQRPWAGLTKDKYREDQKQFEKNTLGEAMKMLRVLIFADGTGQAEYGGRTEYPQHMLASIDDQEERFDDD